MDREAYAAPMDARTITVDTPDGDMELFEAAPDADRRGAVIVVQEAFGVNDHIRDVTQRVAAAGYLAVAPSFFHRAGGGTAEYGQFEQVIPLFEGLDDEAILNDVDAALSHVAAAGFPAEQTGIVGFCFGGRVTFLVALRRSLGAAIGFYGGGIVTPQFPIFPALVDEAGSLQTPWLGLFGDEDAHIPVEDVERLRTELEAAAVPTDVVRYPEADHGFHCDAREAHHPASAADAWARTLAWLDLYL